MVHDHPVFLSATQLWGEICRTSRCGDFCVSFAAHFRSRFILSMTRAVCLCLYNWLYKVFPPWIVLIVIGLDMSMYILIPLRLNDCFQHLIYQYLRKPE